MFARALLWVYCYLLGGMILFACLLNFRNFVLGLILGIYDTNHLRKHKAQGKHCYSSSQFNSSIQAVGPHRPPAERPIAIIGSVAYYV